MVNAGSMAFFQKFRKKGFLKFINLYQNVCLLCLLTILFFYFTVGRAKAVLSQTAMSIAWSMQAQKSHTCLHKSPLYLQKKAIYVIEKVIYVVLSILLSTVTDCNVHSMVNAGSMQSSWPLYRNSEKKAFQNLLTCSNKICVFCFFWQFSFSILQ